MTVNPIPPLYGSVTPYLIIEECAQAIEFYKKVFNATEMERMETPDGKIGHTELQFGDSIIMMASEFPELNFLGPKSVGGSCVTIHLYLENVDEVFARAIEHGATEVEAPVDKFYGDRSASIIDPFGHRWSMATHTEDVSPEEMKKRVQALYPETS